MTAEKPLDSQIKRAGTYRHTLGMCDVVKGKKTNMGRSKGDSGQKWKVRNTSHQGVDGTLSCPSQRKLPPTDSETVVKRDL